MNKILSSALVTAFGIMNLGNAAVAESALPANYQWVIQIDTNKLPNQFQYRHSNMTEVVNAKINYQTRGQSGAGTPFEDLWYSNGHSIGLERHGNLGVNKGDTVLINLTHKGASAASPSVGEQTAGGRAIMKAVLDVSINRNSIAMVTVPQSSFHTIVNEIERFHFTPVSSSDPPESGSSSDLNLYVVSNPPGLSQNFAHIH